MKKYIEIEGDTNDADYVTKRNEITDEQLAEIAPVIKAIKEYNEDESITTQKYNWWDLDFSRRDNPTPRQLYVETGKCTEEEFELFNQFTPYSEHGIHTIESIKILIVQEEIDLL